MFPAERSGYVRPSDDLACGPDDVLQLIATHQLGRCSASERSSWEHSPIGDTPTHLNRIQVETGQHAMASRHVRPSTNVSHRSRLRRCGCPDTLPRNRTRLRSMRGRHPCKVDRVRCVESWRCSNQDRRSGQLWHHRAADDFEAVSHTRKQSVELLVAQVDLAREKLADARLVDAADPSSDVAVPTGWPGTKV